MWWWATWEAAQFCVMAKLRTPLGKPQETFTAIESAIKHFAAQVKNKDEDETGMRRYSEEEGGNGSAYLSQHRVSMLLQFMEQLEQLLYSSYEGCALAILSPPKVRCTGHFRFSNIHLNTTHVAMLLFFVYFRL